MRKIIYKGNEYPIWFCHMREIIDDGTERGRTLPNGGLTRAYIRLDDDTELDGFALCSKDDSYCKKFGRVKSTGRLISYLCKEDANFKKINFPEYCR